MLAGRQRDFTRHMWEDDKETLLDICGRDEKEDFTFTRHMSEGDKLYAITAPCTNYYLITCNYKTIYITEAYVIKVCHHFIE